jgi:uncharacterized protein (TIGR02391 family)
VIAWYIEIRKAIRDIAAKSFDVSMALKSDDEASARTIKEYVKKDYQRLQELWNERIEGHLPTSLGRHISWGMVTDFDDILRRDLPELETLLDTQLAESITERGDLGFEHLIHPAIRKSSYAMFRGGHFREAVLNSVLAIFDLVRERTGMDADGSNLINRAFSLTDPYLVLSELTTESGQNDQKGFIQIFNGSYQGIRNPKAHSLTHDLTDLKASQYLIHASLLARRIEEATSVKTDARKQLAPAAPAKRASAKPRSRS